MIIMVAVAVLSTLTVQVLALLAARAWLRSRPIVFNAALMGIMVEEGEPATETAPDSEDDLGEDDSDYDLDDDEELIKAARELRTGESIGIDEMLSVDARRVQKARMYPLGFPSTLMRKGQRLSIKATPMATYRPQRLIIPSDVAPAFLIEDLMIQRQSQFPLSQPVPARMFTELSIGSDVPMSSCPAGDSITLTVICTGLNSIQQLKMRPWFGKLWSWL